MTAPVRGIVFFLIATFCFALMIALVRLASSTLPAAEILFFRNVVATLLLTPFEFKAMRGTLTLHGHKWWPLLGRAGFSFIGMILWFWSVTEVPLAEAVSIHFVMPILTVIGGLLILGEKVTTRQWIATFMGFAGVLIALRPDSAAISLPHLAVIFSAAAYAASNLCTKSAAASERPGFIVLVSNLLGIPLAALLMVPAWVDPALGEHLPVWVDPTWDDLLPVLGVGVVGAIAHVTVAHAYKLAPIGLMMPLDFLRLPFAAILAWLMFSELPTLSAVLGGLVVFTAALLVNRPARQAPPLNTKVE